MKHAPFAVRDGHDDGLVLAGAVRHRRRRRRCRENRHVLGGTAEIAVELVVGVHPRRRQALHDRVLGGANRHEEIVRAGMLCGAGRVVVEHHTAIAPADLRAGRLGPTGVAGCEPSPAADADHLVVLCPAGKRVVRRVQHHESAAVLHVVDECLLHRRRELETLVVQHDRLVVGELWRKTRHVLIRRRALRWRRRHGDGKAPAVFQ